MALLHENTTLRKSSSNTSKVKKNRKSGNTHSQHRQSDGKKSLDYTNIMYISHLPSGLAEKELRGFFSQFGHVKKVCVARSEITGASKGHGYVEFDFTEIADVAASAVNNRLVYGNRIKAGVVLKKHQKKPRSLLKAPEISKNSVKLSRVQHEQRILNSNGFRTRQTVRDHFLNRKRQLNAAVEELKMAGLIIPELRECLATLESLFESSQDRPTDGNTDKSKAGEETSHAKIDHDENENSAMAKEDVFMHMDVEATEEKNGKKKKFTTKNATTKRT